MTARKRQEQRRLRMAVFKIMGDADFEPYVLIENMALVCKWIETGIVPRKNIKPAKLGFVRPAQQQ